MDQQIWYIYQKGQQMGPFDENQVRQLYTNSMITHDAYIFKVGWKDWQPVEECYQDVGLTQPPGQGTSDAKDAESRRQNAPRATVSGRIDFHNNKKFNTGVNGNISASGIFVETSDHVFEIGDVLKITVRITGIARPFNAIAKVIRYNNDPKFPVGYGLMFSDIAGDVQDEIQRLVESMNQNQHASASSM